VKIMFMTALMTGCGKPAAETADNKIPSFAAGTWQERPHDDWPWTITIETNGIVSSAVTPFVGVEVKPGQTTKVEMADGNVSTFVAGDMYAEYTPATRELFVYVEIKEFHIRVQGIRTDGSRVDRLYGPVSEDGLIWKPDYIDILDLGPELPIDPTGAEATPLVFDKVVEELATGEGKNKKPTK